METIGRSSKKMFSNGDVYTGNYTGMLPHGDGKYTWADGMVYKGEWEEGKMSGKGRVVWPSGAWYEGDFSWGYVQGLGTLTSLDGSVYRGSWKLNIQHGFGEKKYPNSDVYEVFSILTMPGPENFRKLCRCIYFSGSRLAQRLLFGYTKYGDLRKYLCGYFDTTVG